MSLPLIALFIRHEQDVVAARQRARQIAARLGFEGQDQTRIATAVSEIARNAFMYAGGGKVEVAVEGRSTPQLLLVRVSDAGPGIRDLETVLGGRYRSSTGMGVGMLGARRLVDRFEVTSRPGEGTTVTLGKLFSRRAPQIGPSGLAALADALARETPQGPLEEVRQQNQELLCALEELRQRQEDLSRLNAELQDTNRGVLALYAELDEKADTLRRADEMKSRFLSNMSHEFRTPLNSMLALSRLLLEDSAQPLTGEQQRQVGYIRRAAEELTELVNDLLDLAKVEAGKILVRPADFDVRDLFAALRGMLRPLLLDAHVNLVFEEPEEVPPLHTDEGKLSQILRNLLSNALKFTERGEIRVVARPAGEGPHGPQVSFSVADTGIGIAAVDQERIFDEFGQLDSPVQRRVRGTGLGLPLVRRLAALLGGTVSLESAPGVGSTFTIVLPVRLPSAEPVEAPGAEAAAPSDVPAGMVPVLVVEDSDQDLLLYDHHFRGSRYHPVIAHRLPEARQLLTRIQPVAIVLDIRLAGEDAWTFIAEVRRGERTASLPLVAVSSIDDQAKGLALGADAYAIKPVHSGWLLGTLNRLLDRGADRRVLVIDDDEIARYLVRSHLAGAPFQVTEVDDPLAGIREAHASRPDAIVLDLAMPQMSGFEVLDRLKEDPVTMDIPVVVLTSKSLTDEERRRLAPHAHRILSKQALAAGDEAERLRAALFPLAPGEAARG